MYRATRSMRKHFVFEVFFFKNSNSNNMFNKKKCSTPKIRFSTKKTGKNMNNVKLNLVNIM